MIDVEAEHSLGTKELDETIAGMERLYSAVTGQNLPPGEAAYAPIPAEKDPAEHVEGQLSRLLNMLGRTDSDTAPTPLRTWTPPISVWEKDEEIRVCVGLPGVARDKVRVTSEGRVLTISGVREMPKGDYGRLHSSELPVGPFRRVLFVPTASEAEPRAELKEGVLEIRVPREPSRAPKRKSVAVN